MIARPFQSVRFIAGRWLPQSAETRAYALLALAYLAPLWAFRYLPTYDGPAHLHSAVVWRDLEREGSRYPEFYQFQPKQAPNLTSQFLLAWWVRWLPPLTAEKLLASVYVLGFAASYWFFLAAYDRGATRLAPAALFFVYHGAFWAGFYNYCLSLILFWLIAGCSVRLTARPALQLAAGLSFLFCAAYLTHLVGWLLSLAASVWFAAAHSGGRARKTACVALAAIPSALLAADYFHRTRVFGSQGVPVLVGRWFGQMTATQLSQRLDQLLDCLFAPSEPSSVLIGGLVFALFQALVIATVAAPPGPDQENAVSARSSLVLSLLFAAVYFLTPDHLGQHGGFIVTRLAFLPPMLLLPSLRLPAGRRGLRAMTFLIYATAAANLISATLFVRSANKEIAEYTAGTAAVGSDAAIFAVEPPPNVRYPDYLKHASCYYCLDRGNVALESYQGEPGPFWIQFREGVFRARGPFFSYANKGRVDFVLVWDNDRENIPDLVDCREVFRQRRLRVLSHARTVKKQVHH